VAVRGERRDDEIDLTPPSDDLRGQVVDEFVLVHAGDSRQS
jgi:hypothetical protein